jgi:predicted YcjX-like family ATPase
MRADTSEMLSRIDASQNALLEAAHSTQDQLETMMGLLRQLIDLLLPKESGQDGSRLDDLLARMIAQQSAMIELGKQTVACVTRIEAALAIPPGEDAPQRGNKC